MERRSFLQSLLAIGALRFSDVILPGPAVPEAVAEEFDYSSSSVASSCSCMGGPNCCSLRRMGKKEHLEYLRRLLHFCHPDNCERIYKEHMAVIATKV